MDDLEFPAQPEKPKMDKKKIGIICGIVGGVLVVAIAVVIILSAVLQPKADTGWGAQYYSYLKAAAAENKASEIGLSDNTKYMLSFLKFDDTEMPIMVLREADGKYLNLYRIESEDKISFTQDQQKYPSDVITVEYLYDNYREVYDYFAHFTRNKKQSEYISLSDGDTDYVIDANDVRTAKDYATGEVYSVSQYDQTLIDPEVQLPEEKEFFFTPDEAKFAENKANFDASVKAYQPVSELLTNEKKTAVTQKASEINETLNTIADLIADQTVAEDNFHEFVDEDLKYFLAAYLGPVYGWNTIYKYDKRPSSECEAYKPLESSGEYPFCYILTGAGSKAEMKEELLKHISETTLANIDRKYIAGTMGDFVDYNGNVWWMLEGGIGGVGYGSLSPANATFGSVNDKTNSVTVYWKLRDAAGDVCDNFTITLQAEDGDYKVVSYTHSDR